MQIVYKVERHPLMIIFHDLIFVVKASFTFMTFFCDLIYCDETSFLNIFSIHSPFLFTFFVHVDYTTLKANLKARKSHEKCTHKGLEKAM